MARSSCNPDGCGLLFDGSRNVGGRGLGDVRRGFLARRRVMVMIRWWREGRELVSETLFGTPFLYRLLPNLLTLLSLLHILPKYSLDHLCALLGDPRARMGPFLFQRLLPDNEWKRRWAGVRVRDLSALSSRIMANLCNPFIG